jgi:Protein of unknown function (DUF501)
MNPSLLLLVVVTTAIMWPETNGSFSTALAMSRRTARSFETDAVAQQLGYLPPNFLRVSAWNNNYNDVDDKRHEKSHGITAKDATCLVPLAIQTYPLQGGAKRRQAKASLPGNKVSTNVQSPFPTLYWLTCPHLSRAVGDLERQGFLQVVQDHIQRNQTLAARLMTCHYEYAKERWASLTDTDRQSLLEADSTSPLGGMREILQHSGISGSNLTSSSLIWPPKDGKSCQMSTKIQTFDIEIPPIKCLHAHYAQYLSCTSTRVSWCARDVTVVSKDLLESYSFLHHSPITNPVGEMIHDQLQKEYPSLWY